MKQLVFSKFGGKRNKNKNETCETILGNDIKQRRKISMNNIDYIHKCGECRHRTIILKRKEISEKGISSSNLLLFIQINID